MSKAKTRRGAIEQAGFGFLAAIFAFSVSGCRCEETPEPAPSPDPSTTPNTDSGDNPSLSKLDLLSLRSRCTLHQEGVVIDMGSPATEARRMFRLVKEAPPERTTRAGESYRKFDQMGTDFVFWLTEELKEFELSARVHGLGSERMAAYIDGKRLGAASLKPDKTRNVRISARDRVLEPGRHKLTLSLSRPRGGVPEAEIGWVRLGPRHDEPSPAPATRRETFEEVTIGETRLPSIVLRPSASLRCPVWIPRGTTFEAQVGVWGEGPAEVEFIVHTKRGERIVVAADERKDDDPRAFARVEADLSQFADELIDLELAAPKTLKRARIAIGTPILKSQTKTGSRPPPAQRAIVVLLSGLGEKHTPPTAAQHGLPFLGQFAADAAHFSNYRTSTTSVAGIVASLMTGTAPWSHRVQRFTDELSPELMTLASSVEAQGGRSSFFTGVPLSFEPLGFARGFEKFTQVGPQEDRPAEEPLSLAQKWLSTALKHDGPVLSVVHLRGGHPPFDVTKEAAVDLAPKEYGGDLSPRRAAIQMAEIRARRSRRHRRMPNEDWTRLFALQKAALLRQSAQLSEFTQWLRKKEAYDDTLLVVMGDLGSGERPNIPFGTKAELRESMLAPPLLVKFPGAHHAGAKLDGFFSPRDVATTVASFLGLKSQEQMTGIDLGSANAVEAAALRPHVAYRDGEYSMRLGSHVLLGEDGSAPFLCHPALDPTCQEDRADQQILEARALWYAAWNILSPALSDERFQPKDNREEENPESFFDNALTVWGADR